jgi:hypothetical protein
MRVLSPPITGITGMGADGIDRGLAITQDRVWASSFAGAILLMDLKGNPIGKESDFALVGKVGVPQGIAIAPNGDVWVAMARPVNCVKIRPIGNVQRFAHRGDQKRPPGSPPVASQRAAQKHGIVGRTTQVDARLHGAPRSSAARGTEIVYVHKDKMSAAAYVHSG